MHTLTSNNNNSSIREHFDNEECGSMNSTKEGSSTTSKNSDCARPDWDLSGRIGNRVIRICINDSSGNR